MESCISEGRVSDDVMESTHGRAVDQGRESERNSLNNSDGRVNIRLKRRECCGRRFEGEEEMRGSRAEEMFIMRIEREAAGSPDSS